MGQPRFGAIRMVDVVVARQADREDVRDIVLAKRFAGNCGACKVERKRIPERARQQRAVERRAGLVLAFADDLGKLAALAVPGAVVGARARIGRFGQQRRPSALEKPVRGLRVVEGRNPGRVRLHVIGARREAAAVAHVHVRGAGLAGGQDRAAVLAGDADDLGARVRAPENVADGLDLQVPRAGARQLFGPVVQVGVGFVTRVVDRLRGNRVAPLVADDPGAIGISTGQHRCVPGRRHGERVPVVRVREPGSAVEEARKAVGRELIAVVHDLALRQAVHHEKNHEPGLADRGAIRRGAGAEQDGGEDDGTEDAREAPEFDGSFHARSLRGNYYSRKRIRTCGRRTPAANQCGASRHLRESSDRRTRP